jgi:hypothetical protein
VSVSHRLGGFDRKQPVIIKPVSAPNVNQSNALTQPGWVLPGRL